MRGASLRGVHLGVGLAALLLSLETGLATSPPLVYIARLEDDAISPGTAGYIERAVEKAEMEGAECLVVVLDTPGGLLQSTRRIVKGFLSSRVPVVVYVAPSGAQAASAGVFVGLASHVLAMAPGTTIGAAHPVQVGGLPTSPSPAEPGGTENEESEDGKEVRPEGSPLEQKIVNSTVAWARSLAQRRGRNADWAERAVAESITSTAPEAVEKGVAEFLAADTEELLHKLDGLEVDLPQGGRSLSTAGAELHPLPMWWGERVLALLAQPNLAFLLLMIGFYGILFEFYNPGWGVAGTIGVICLLLGFFGLAVLPVNALGILFVALAIGLFVAEVFVTSFGVLALTGAVCMVIGGLMLVDSPTGFSRVSLSVLIPLALATMVIVLVLVTGILRAYRGGTQTGPDALVTESARAYRDFRAEDDQYSGTVLVHGERWRAVSPAPLAGGRPCRITGRKGLTLFVTPEAAEEGGESSGKPPMEEDRT